MAVRAFLTAEHRDDADLAREKKGTSPSLSNISTCEYLPGALPEGLLTSGETTMTVVPRQEDHCPARKTEIWHDDAHRLSTMLLCELKFFTLAFRKT